MERNGEDKGAASPEQVRTETVCVAASVDARLLVPGGYVGKDGDDLRKGADKIDVGGA